MNWKTIFDWTFYVFAAILEAIFLTIIISNWGTPVAWGYMYACVWLLFFVFQTRNASGLDQVAKSALAGWNESLKYNDTLIDMVMRLKMDLRQKDELLKQKTIVVVKPGTVATPTRAPKRLKVKAADVKRRGKLRR